MSFVFSWLEGCSGPGSSLCQVFEITPRHTTLDRTPVREWSAHYRYLYLTTHNTHKRQISIPSAGFEPTAPARERPHTHVSGRAATDISLYVYVYVDFVIVVLVVTFKVGHRVSVYSPNLYSRRLSGIQKSLVSLVLRAVVRIQSDSSEFRVQVMSLLIN
jgi:hypothetical protein